MLVSVIMSVYNENVLLLKQSIESILNQTYKDFEFIIVLDNPENKHIKTYLNWISIRDKRIKLVENKKNLGLSKSLNKAIDISKGEFIFRMDADDISYIDRFEKQLDFMIDNDLDISSSLVKKIDSNNNILFEQSGFRNHLFSKELNKLLKHQSVMAHPTWCVKKEVYKKLKYRDLVPVEDYDFILRAIELNLKLGLINDYLLLYRDSSKGISNTNFRKQKISTIVLQDFFGSLLKTEEKIIQNAIVDKDNRTRNIDFKKYEELRINFTKKKDIFSFFILIHKLEFLLLLIVDIKKFFYKKIVLYYHF